MKKLGIISLGCDKNRVDTEKMLSYLKGSDLEIVDDLNTAEIIIINTCAFIDKARKESIDTILDAIDLKQNNCRKIIVSGCLSQKYLDELKKELPEVDAFLGTSNYSEIVKVIKRLYNGETYYSNIPKDNDVIDRVLTTPLHYAYLKIAEGCDNYCTFCSIPSIRGKYTSRTKDKILDEAKNLADMGVKELILVAQDTGRYGSDLYKDYDITDLLFDLTKIDGIEWIRLLYCYPETINERLLNLIVSQPKICDYLDIPLQHIDNMILKRMNRRITEDGIKNLIYKIRESGDISIRSSFILGFPQESDSQFEKLLFFLEEFKLDNVGFFTYSREEGTPAANMPNQIPSKIKNSRLRQAAAVQQKIVVENNKKKRLNKTLKVLYEGIDFDKNLFFGRTQYNAPEVDTLVYFSGNYAEIGNFYDVKITDILTYDLKGEMQ
ncbi:MAG TPA: 30S ribosomal protein S12 methylthiotransferase RimO [Clostridiales bacterium]|jgi:ribosomal protein S12 methylthiotransferase|nr:30S ribosomal protein S12 methylthiotransferase RimO [Clostridiales bacterium]